MKHSLLRVIGYPFFSEFQLVILFTLTVRVSRKKNQPKVSPGFGEKMCILISEMRFWLVVIW